MPRVATRCPSCDGRIQAERLRCCDCGVQLEGRFDFPALLQLPADDLAFVTEFVTSSGSLKQMARLRGQSYPTIRNRLDEIIARLQALQAPPDQARRRILDAVAKGDLSVKDAVGRLAELGAGGGK
jgi:hypothetical protein